MYKNEEMKILVIRPAYNEEKNIKETVERLKESAASVDYVVINDCSKDRTERILKNLGITYISLPVNLGIGGAVQTGYKYGVENGYDIVIGSRFVDEKKHFSMRMLGSRIITAMIKLTTGATINDPTSGMRIINKELIKDYAFELNRKPEPDTLAFQIKKGYKAKEVQVKMEDRLAGTSIYTGIGSSIQYMLKVLITIIFFN